MSAAQLFHKSAATLSVGVVPTRSEMRPALAALDREANNPLADLHTRFSTGVP